MNKDELDQLFDEAFQKAAEKMPPTYKPDHRNAWNQIQKKMKPLQRKKAFQKMIFRFGLIAASVLFGAVLVGNPVVTQAFTPFYQSVKTLPDQMVSFFFGNKDNPGTGNKTKPPRDVPKSTIPSSGGDLQTIAIHPEEASQKVVFALPSFSYPPSGYTLTRTEIFLNPGELQSKEIMYTYVNPDKKIFRITLNKLENDSSIGSGASNNGELIETLQLHNGTAYLTMARDGTNKLEFLWTGVYIHMMGFVSKEELIKVAENMTK
jgi:hypothetical protein